MNRTNTGWIVVIISWMIFIGGLILAWFYWELYLYSKAIIIFSVGTLALVLLRLLVNIEGFLLSIAVGNDRLESKLQQILNVIDRYSFVIMDLQRNIESKLHQILTTLNSHISVLVEVGRSIESKSHQNLLAVQKYSSVSKDNLIALSESIEDISLRLEKINKSLQDDVGGKLESKLHQSLLALDKHSLTLKDILLKDIEPKLPRIESKLHQHLLVFEKHSEELKKILVSDIEPKLPKLESKLHQNLMVLGELIKSLKEDVGVKLESKLQQNLVALDKHSAAVKKILETKIDPKIPELESKLHQILNSLEKNSLTIKGTLENQIEAKLQQNVANAIATIDQLKNVDQTLQQINCDSKDLNQNLFKLTSFLEEIERHLNLKK